MIILLLVCLWYFVGIAGFIFWWTREFDFTVAEVLPTLLCSFMGPLAFGFGLFEYLVNCDFVIFKKTVIVKKKRK